MEDLESKAEDFIQTPGRDATPNPHTDLVYSEDVHGGDYFDAHCVDIAFGD